MSIRPTPTPLSRSSQPLLCTCACPSLFEMRPCYFLLRLHVTYLKVIFKLKLLIIGKNDLLSKSWIIRNKSLDTGGKIKQTSKESRSKGKCFSNTKRNTFGSALGIMIESLWVWKDGKAPVAWLIEFPPLNLKSAWNHFEQKGCCSSGTARWTKDKNGNWRRSRWSESRVWTWDIYFDLSAWQNLKWLTTD